MAQQPQHFDLVVIGGGSGGSGVTKRSAGYGKKVCIIERGVQYKDGVRVGAGVGGTCVNVGCVPKKLMFQSAAIRESMVGSAELATGLGYGDAAKACGDMVVDWVGLKERRDAYVKRLNGVYESGWEKLGVDVKHGFASVGKKVDGKSAVSIKHEDGSTSTVTADHIVVAVGGEPSTPDVPGAEYGISSDGFFDLPTQPKKCAVFGAGYIAVEMAGILNAMGTETDLFCRGDKILRNADVFDSDIVSTLMSELKKHGPTVRPGSDVKELVKAADGSITVELKDGSSHPGYDCVLWAIGRHPVTSGIGLEEAGAKMTRGFVHVDKYENVLDAEDKVIPGLHALGDCTVTGWELTPVAIAAGRRLGDRLFANEPRARFIYEDVPTVIFSHPPIGTIGYTEAKAIKQFGADSIQVKKATFGSMLYAFNAETDHKVMTTLKLVLQGEEERVVGLHLIGPASDEMLQGFAIAVKMGATRRDFEAVCAIHPTIGEEAVTLGSWGQKDGKPWLPPQISDEGMPGSTTRVAAAAATVLLAAGAFVYHRFCRK
eukprot:TRINITY_DN851_c0_g1_i2.p1 TRINITY_DN851_c0_g1~~TRINITY_DN851_c0_g1_i2.p1  ORF type:complete len:544 (+),score=160.06 TRINITY_DN851_c0_g1_i2:205-1836(+)